MRLDRQRVYEKLDARGWKVADLWRAARQQKSDLTQATVWNAANGRRETSAEVAQALAVVLETSVDYLVGSTDLAARPAICSDTPPMAPELIPLVRYLNQMTADERGEVVSAIMKLLHITYNVSPWVAYMREGEEPSLTDEEAERWARILATATTQQEADLIRRLRRILREAGLTEEQALDQLEELSPQFASVGVRQTGTNGARIYPAPELSLSGSGERGR